MYRYCVIISVFLATVALASCDNNGAATVKRQAPPPAPLLGRWVQVFPEQGALESMVLSADGTADFRGSNALVQTLTGQDSANIKLTKWFVGHRFMPGGLCIGNDEQRWCVGWKISGDTLALANLRQSIFLRQQDGAPPVATVAWTQPHFTAAEPPAPLDTVRNPGKGPSN
jgi:hypothetical protein